MTKPKNTKVMLTPWWLVKGTQEGMDFGFWLSWLARCVWDTEGFWLSRLVGCKRDTGLQAKEEAEQAGPTSRSSKK